MAWLSLFTVETRKKTRAISMLTDEKDQIWKDLKFLSSCWLKEMEDKRWHKTQKLERQWNVSTKATKPVSGSALRLLSDSWSVNIAS